MLMKLGSGFDFFLVCWVRIRFDVRKKINVFLFIHVFSMSSMLELYKNEDVSVGTWLAGAKVTRIHDER